MMLKPCEFFFSQKTPKHQVLEMCVSADESKRTKTKKIVVPDKVY